MHGPNFAFVLLSLTIYRIQCFFHAPILRVHSRGGALVSFMRSDAESGPVVANTSTQTSSINSDETWTIRPDPGATLDLTEENVVKVLDEIRPYLQSDGGDVEVANINLVTRDIEVSLQGACGNCPSSTTTMKMGIERVLRENFDNLGSITAVNLTEEATSGENRIDIETIKNTLNNILPAIQGMGGSVDVKSVEPVSGEVVVVYEGPARLRKGVELVLKDIKGVNAVRIEERM